MPYAHTTFGQLKAQLSLRLFDAANTFFTSTEIGLYLTEALRTFGLCSGFWRARGNISITANTVFYDLNALLTDGATLFLKPTVTDRDIIQQLQYALLESTTSQVVWSGTEMFTYADLANAVQNRLNQFLSDTGVVVNRSVINVASPPIGRQSLSQNTIDVRRVAWLGAAPQDYYTTLWREDERMLTAYGNDWQNNTDTPDSYSIMAPPPLQIQLAPVPLASGQLELLTVDSTSLDPANQATVLGIPDNLTPAIKWGALADLLGKDGIARDPARAQFAESRYAQYVQLARTLPVVLNAELNGVPLIPSTLQEMDSSTPQWQNIPCSPANPIQDIILCAPNLVCFGGVPDQAYSATFDVVRASPIYTDVDSVQIGREQLDMILDYAEHLALFKVGGGEWHATERQANNFLMQSITYNQRISAAARAIFSAAEQSQRQKQEIPRRVESWLKKTFGTGALKVGDDAGN